jgi:hypothetical protein
MLLLKLAAVFIVASIVYTITTKFIKDKEIEMLEFEDKVRSENQFKIYII